MYSYSQPLSPRRTVVTSFTPRKPDDGVSAFEEGDWVLCLASSSSCLVPHTSTIAPTVACALSNGRVQVYDQQSLLPVTSFVPGDPNIASVATDLLYGPHDTVIVTAHDGSVSVTDLRQPMATAIRSTLSSSGGGIQESALSISIGFDGYLAAVASDKARVHFMDLRTGSFVGRYVDSHTIAVTQVVFHPEKRSLLASAGEDGLVCIYDTTQPSEEAALGSVVNIGTPCRRLGFWGETGIYCLTGSETASLWDFYTSTCLEDFGGSSLRENLSSLLPTRDGATIDYLVDARWDATNNQLQLCAGNSKGDAILCQTRPTNGGIGVLSQNLPCRWQLSDMLVGGHKGRVRAWCTLSEAKTEIMGGGTAGGQVVCKTGSTFITAGEDARLCEWRCSLGQSSVSTRALPTPTTSVQAIQMQAPRLFGGGPIRRQRRHSKQSAAPY